VYGRCATYRLRHCGPSLTSRPRPEWFRELRGYHIPQESGPSRAPRAHQEKQPETWGCSRLVGWPAYPRAIVIRLFALDRQALLWSRRYFPQEPRCLRSAQRAAPKCRGRRLFRRDGTPTDVGPGREKRPKPLEHQPFHIAAGTRIPFCACGQARSNAET
jgi:hypothetical protein